MEEEIIEDVEEIDTVIAELEISKGKGNLILCVVNSPLYRDRIIQTLGGRFSSKVISAKNGENIISILKRKSFDGADVLMWVMPEEPTEDLLNTLNNFRELFYESKIPNLIFYNQAFSESVIRRAPDFWRYRGNYYELKETERGLTFEALEALTTTLTFKDEEDLLRRKRINEYLLEKVRDKTEKMAILSELGLILYYLGELDKALEYHLKSLKMGEELGEMAGIAIQLGNIGVVYQTKGELNLAQQYHEKALKLNEELGNKKSISADYGNLGIVYEIKGEFDKALEYHKKALELNEKSGIKEGVANQLGNIGTVYYLNGKLDLAMEYFEKALELDEELGRRTGIASQIRNIGNVYKTKGLLDKALEYFEKALELNEKLGIKDGIAGELGNIGTVYHLKGELDKALEYYTKALEIFKGMGSRLDLAKVLMNIGDIFIQKGERERAIDYYLRAQELALDAPLFNDISKRVNKLMEIK